MPLHEFYRVLGAIFVLFCFDLLVFDEKSYFQEAIPYYRISLFLSYEFTKYDKIVLVGISATVHDI